MLRTILVSVIGGVIGAVVETKFGSMVIPVYAVLAICALIAWRMS